jgi:hypothetical protein
MLRPTLLSCLLSYLQVEILNVDMLPENPHAVPVAHLNPIHCGTECAYLPPSSSDEEPNPLFKSLGEEARRVVVAPQSRACARLWTEFFQLLIQQVERRMCPTSPRQARMT